MTAEKSQIPSDWYEVRHISDGIDLIVERYARDWMRCNIWLVRGRDRDLLIDAGLGLRPLKAEIARLREHPVTCLCSHCHFDHIGGAYEFETRLGHHLDADVHANPDLDRTCARAWIGGDLLAALPCEGYRLDGFRITPAPLTGYLNEGDVIDLGDRVFDVFHLPGHAPGSIALYERKTRILFSGDVIYDGGLIDNAWHSDPEAYRRSLRRLLELPVEVIHAGHDSSFGRERLHQLINEYLAGGLRLGDPAAYVARMSAAGAAAGE
jgi:glyoxylase-like metal-dependent hydrolase (beta-lactamase superfamily II)